MACKQFNYVNTTKLLEQR